MAIRKQYEKAQEQQNRKLVKKQKHSIIASVTFFMLLINYFLFVRSQTDNEHQHGDRQPYSFLVQYKSSLFQILADLYIGGATIFNILIFKMEHSRLTLERQTIGNLANYNKFYIQLFKIINFGIIVACLIRVLEQGHYQILFNLAIGFYCFLQLTFARAIQGILARKSKAETSLQEAKDDDDDMYEEQ